MKKQNKTKKTIVGFYRLTLLARLGLRILQLTNRVVVRI